MKKDTDVSFIKLDLLIIGVILVLSLVLRLYKINEPLADYHSWRQVDTAAVARNMTRDGFDFLHPRYDDLSNVQTGFENPEGYRFVEFPLYNSIFAAFYKVMPFMSLEVWGRLTSILFSLIGIAIIYYLALKDSGRIAAAAASVTLGILPFSVFFSRTVLPEATTIGLSLLSIFFMYLFVEGKSTVKNWIMLLLSSLCFAGALLVKPTAIFFLIVILYLFLRKYTIRIVTQLPVYVFLILALVPLLAWRYYILSFPEGIPGSDWLITSVNTSQGLQPIFMKPAFFRWIFFERINNMILGGFLTSLAVIGVLRRQRSYLFYSFLATALLYLLVFQGGNVQHEYYQTLILPSLALAVGYGVDVLIRSQKIFVQPLISAAVVVVLFAASFYFSYYRVRDFYSYPKDLTQIAKIISSLTDKDDKIVTDTLGDTTLLYLADRKGAPAVYKDLEELKKSGYSFFYTNKSDVIQQIKDEKKFTVKFENDKFALFEL